MDPVIAWLAKERELDAALISHVSFEASEGRAWSEITVEDFSCFVKFTYNGDPQSHYLDEGDVVRMLNEAYPA